MKKPILIVSVLACVIMLLLPSITAVEYSMMKKEVPPYTPEYEKDELKNAILQRIEDLKQQQKDIHILGMSWEDPDGAFEGGLDDYTDIISLGYGLYWSGLFLTGFMNGYLKNAVDFLDFIETLVLFYGNLSLLTFIYLGEAFDVVDIVPIDNR